MQEAHRAPRAGAVLHDGMEVCGCYLRVAMRERGEQEEQGELIGGTVIRIDSGASQVNTPAGVLRCVMRGRLAGTRAARTPRRADDGDGAPGKRLKLAVGDEVRVRPLRPGDGVIEEILPRRTKLSRLASGGKLEQVVAANIDQLIIVSSLLEPPLNLNLVDRYLVAADRGGLRSIVCINKVDLGEADRREMAAAQLRTYESLGYPVVWTSASTAAGIDELRAFLAGHTSVLAGKSGVGKSALLNAVEPGLHLASVPISASTGKGRHTTSFTSLLPLTAGGYVIDTPGVRQYTLWEVDPATLDRHFPEIAALEDGCRFANCIHSHEPGCAVKAGVATGQVAARRYASYLRILEGLDEE